jgi:hypothetical protein
MSPGFQSARVGALVGKLKAEGVPEHVRVGLEANNLPREYVVSMTLSDCHRRIRSHHRDLCHEERREEAECAY